MVATSTTANEIISDYDRIRPDVAIIDYKLPNDKNGLDATLQILNKYPSAAIIDSYRHTRLLLKKLLKCLFLKTNESRF